MAIPQAVAGAGKIPRQYPVEDFFRNPRRGFFQLSDDGSMLGFMEPVSIDGGPARMNVFVQALQGSALVGSARRLTSETERRSEEHTSELQSLMRISYAVFCLEKKNK